RDDSPSLNHAIEFRSIEVTISNAITFSACASKNVAASETHSLVPPAEGSKMGISKPAREISILLVSTVTVLAASPAWSDPPSVARSPQVRVEESPARRAGVLELRIGSETLRNPYWYAENGRQDEARQFWDKKAWDRVFTGWAAEDYNAIL